MTDEAKMQAALEHALSRVIDLERELSETQRRARNIEEARKRALAAAARATEAEQVLRKEADRLRDEVASARHHSDEELWKHRQWIYLLATSWPSEDDRRDVILHSQILEGFPAGSGWDEWWHALYRQARRADDQGGTVMSDQLTPVLLPDEVPNNPFKIASR